MCPFGRGITVLDCARGEACTAESPTRDAGTAERFRTPGAFSRSLAAGSVRCGDGGPLDEEESDCYLISFTADVLLDGFCYTTVGGVQGGDPSIFISSEDELIDITHHDGYYVPHESWMGDALTTQRYRLTVYSHELFDLYDLDIATTAP